MSQNHVFLVGRVGREPRLSKTSSAKVVCNLSVATERQAKDVEARLTDWHRVVCWGSLAEVCARHLKTGSMVAVQGRLNYRKWKDDSGQLRFGVDIVAHQVSFVTANKDERDGQSRLVI